MSPDNTLPVCESHLLPLLRGENAFLRRNWGEIAFWRRKWGHNEGGVVGFLAWCSDAHPENRIESWNRIPP